MVSSLHCTFLFSILFAYELYVGVTPCRTLSFVLAVDQLSIGDLADILRIINVPWIASKFGIFITKLFERFHEL